ncbi:MAG: CBS domain-containing protein, partial [Gammaproteobacteria bacterium]
MPGSTTQEQSADRLHAFFELIHEGDAQQLVEKLEELHPAEIAHLLEALPREDRQKVWELIDLEDNGDVLLYVNDDVRAELIKGVDNDDLVSAAQSYETDDLADILIDLPDDVTEQLLQSMDEQNRQRLEAVMLYPQDTAGGLMNTDTVTVRADLTLDVVLRYLRRRGKVPEMTDNLIVVDRDGKYQGTMLLTDLITKDPGYTVSEIMSRETEAIPATTPAREVASMFEQRDLVSAPVVDNNNQLLGRITIDDVVDVIRDEA